MDEGFAQELKTVWSAIMKLTEIVKKQILKEAGGWEAPERKVYKELEKLSDKVYRVIGTYAHKADMETAIHTWMVGLHTGLKKRGYKIK